MTRVLLTGDWHCGSRWGLTPPRWQTEEHQRKLWKVWEDICAEEYGVAIANGDLIDGAIDVTDRVAVDRIEQLKMAAEALKKIKAKKVYIVLGTPAHTGGDGIYEEVLGEGHTELRLKVEGVRMHIRHKAGSSSTPYGTESQLMKEAVRQAYYDQEVLGLEKPMLVIRSHIHRYTYIQGEHVHCLAVPCLQYPYAWYGATRMSWGYTMGVVVLDVDGDQYAVKPRLVSLKRGNKYERV